MNVVKTNPALIANGHSNSARQAKYITAGFPIMVKKCQDINVRFDINLIVEWEKGEHISDGGHIFIVAEFFSVTRVLFYKKIRYQPMKKEA
jgi:hypothetical protein